MEERAGERWREGERGRLMRDRGDSKTTDFSTTKLPSLLVNTGPSGNPPLITSHASSKCLLHTVDKHVPFA